jgi:hypothetical protein
MPKRFFDKVKCRCWYYKMHNSRVVIVRFLIGLIRYEILTIVGNVATIGFLLEKQSQSH